MSQLTYTITYGTGGALRPPSSLTRSVNSSVVASRSGDDTSRKENTLSCDGCTRITGICQVIWPHSDPGTLFTLYFLLKACKKKHKICEKRGVLRVCYIGGGAAIDLVGLLSYLYERQTPPRDLEVHFIDRSPQWRRFHNALFGTILPKYFAKTRALPYYHDVDLLGPSPNYSPSIQSAFDSNLFVLSNVLSEFSDAEQRPMKEHLWFLLRCARRSFYLAVADSNAKKLRPRLSWLEEFVDRLGFRYAIQFDDEYTVSCDWLEKDKVSERIFYPTGPAFLTSVKRRGFVAKILAGETSEHTSPQ